MATKAGYEEVGLKAGLEIHQQLDTQTKLFCKCPTRLRDKKESNFSFMRYLRASKSEMGEVDAAALEEVKYSQTFLYKSYDSTCLVENDEEPPRELNREAIDIALEVALMLKMSPLDEIHTMRKIVIDGSNTCGFQRTALIATDGVLQTEEGHVRVDSLCLEEDAAQKIESEGDAVVYSLDRLGIPLVEICTAPDIRTVDQASKVAEQLGMILRSTGKVKRGLGTIRQDINISIEGGARVELKGVQNLRLIGRLVENELIRQLKLIELKKTLNKRGARVEHRIEDLSCIFMNSASRVIKKADGNVYGVCLRGFAGLLGVEIQPDRRFGSEFADFARKYSAGLMHTDELPAYGITEDEVKCLRGVFDAVAEDDCVVIVAAGRERAEKALKAVLLRAEAAMRGIPTETRRALLNGTSAYMRPLPGAARMYPETDVPPVEIDMQKLEQIQSNLPETFEHRKARYMETYHLNDELADKIARNVNFTLFEQILDSYEDIPATLVVRTLTDTLVELMQDGMEVELLENQHFMNLFEQLSANAFGKEAIPAILKLLAKEPEMSVEQTIAEIGLKVDMAEVKQLIVDIVNSKMAFIRENGVRAVGPLMGVVMKELRGKVDGKVINKILEEQVKEVLSG
ncbi:MAG: Glu-tRNA(Gln) amidotransferase subunit GatE [Halobacteriota archaeon]